jgi:hypothetical protein
MARSIAPYIKIYHVGGIYYAKQILAGGHLEVAIDDQWTSKEDCEAAIQAKWPGIKMVYAKLVKKKGAD